MIDIRILRDSPERVRNNLEKRNMSNFPIEQLAGLDAERRELITHNQSLKEERNKVSSEIANRKKDGREANELIERMRKISEEITANDKAIESISSRLEALAVQLPNFVDEDVPIGKDDTANKEIHRWGSASVRLDTDHLDIGRTFDLIDTERAAEVAGSRFYFLRRDLVRLNYALISCALDFMRSRGFVLIQPPYMLKRDAIEGAVMLSDFEDVIYKVEDEDLYLIGTSEHAIASMHMGEVFRAADLPLRYAGVSPCFRKEAGAHGKDTKGIFRVHQFEKVEQFVFCKPSDSEEQHKLMLANAEEFMQALAIPYRVVLLSSGDMGKVASKTYDIEGWMPSQNKFRELISCSNCTDFQARSLGIKYRERAHEESAFLHTLNSTLVATERALVAIVENYYDGDANVIRVPDSLVAYMNGIQTLTPVS